jgi:hypothetical protein
MSNAPTVTRVLPSFRLEALDGLLKKLSKKASKLGVAAPTYKVTTTEVRDVSDTDVPYLVEFSTVEIAYDVIRAAGNWTFLAKLEAADEVDGVPRNKVSGVNLTNDQSARYITTNMCCEHCGIKRKRNATYIVMDGSDKTLQVGSSCLRDFLGVDPAAAVNGIEYATIINEVGEGDDWGYGGSSAPRVMPMDEFAAATLSLVSKNGFVKAADAEFGNGVTTGRDVVTLLLDNNPKLADWRAKMTPTDEHKAQAALVVKTLADRILPNYKSNPAALDQFSFKFGILLNKGFVGVKDAQLAAAAIYFESGKIAKENAKGGIKRNELMPGAVEGQKLEFVGTVQSVKDVFSTFGTSLLVTFVSESGHIVKTFYSGKNEEFNTGVKVSVKGTVKKLEVSEKWGSSVMLSRVKIVA